MNRLRIGCTDDKYMMAQTKHAVKCIEKHCRKVRCATVNIDETDLYGMIRCLSDRKADAIVVNYRDIEQCLGDCEYDEHKNGIWEQVAVAAMIRDVDDRYVLVTQKKNGRHFANAHVLTDCELAGRQLEDIYDGVSTTYCREDTDCMFERLVTEMCDGLLMPASRVINAGFDKNIGFRYNYYGKDVIIPAPGENILIILCRKNLSFMESISMADNRYLRREMTLSLNLLRKLHDKIKDDNTDKDYCVSAGLVKDKMSISLYVRGKAGGMVVRQSGNYRDRADIIQKMIETVLQSVEYR